MKKMLFLITILFIVFSLCSCTKTTNDIKELNIEYETEQNLNSFTIIIKPINKIKELTINLKIYNQKYEIIYEDTITKNNLKSRYSYRYTFEYNIIDNLTMDKFKWNIEGKINRELTAETFSIIIVTSCILATILLFKYAIRKDKKE